MTINDIVLIGLADTGDADGQAGDGRCGVTTDDIDVPFVACLIQSGIEIFDVLNLKPLANGQGDGHLAWSPVHGEDVGDVLHSRLVAQFTHGYIGEVKMNALHEHVGRDENFGVRIVHHGAIIPHSIYR